MSSLFRTRTLVTVLSSALAVVACNKRGDAGATSAGTDGGSPTATGAAVANTAPAANATPTFGAGFEGAIVMHTSGSHGTNDMLVLAKGGKLRIDVPNAEGQVAHSIFDPAQQQITVIMPTQELAMQMPLPAAKSPGGTAMGTTTSKLTRTGKHETVAGYDCEDWDIAMGNGSRESVCVAQGLSFFDFSAMAGPTGGSARSWAEDLREQRAFPLRAVEYDPSGKEASRLEVTRIQAKSLDDETFAVPPNYHLMKVPGTSAGGMGYPPHGPLPK